MGREGGVYRDGGWVRIGGVDGLVRICVRMGGWVGKGWVGGRQGGCMVREMGGGGRGE